MKDYLQAVAPKTVPLTEKAFGPSNVTSLYWLAGAGFLINAHGTLIMIDPVIKTMPGKKDVCETGLKLLVDYPIDSADVPKVDAVLYTHSDDDHMGFNTVKDLSRLDPIMIGPPPVFRKLVSFGVKPDKIEMCRIGDQFSLGNVKIDIIHADHPWQLLDVEKYGKPFRIGDCCGFIITTPDGRFFFPGDTRLMEEHLLIKDIDVLALDVSICEYHLNHHGTITLANSLSNAFLIPYHYGTFDAPDAVPHCGDPEDVLDKIVKGRERVRHLAPGQPFSIKEGQEYNQE